MEGQNRVISSEARRRLTLRVENTKTLKKNFKVAIILFPVALVCFVSVHIMNSVATEIGVLIIWAVVNLAFLRLQEQWEKERARKNL